MKARAIFFLLLFFGFFFLCDNPVDDNKENEESTEPVAMKFGGYWHSYGVTKPHLLTLTKLSGPPNATCENPTPGDYIAEGAYDLTNAENGSDFRVYFTHPYEETEFFQIPDGQLTGSYTATSTLTYKSDRNLGIAISYIDTSSWPGQVAIDVIEPYTRDKTPEMEVMEQLACVINGEGNPQALGYNYGSYSSPHKIVLLKEDGNPLYTYNDSIPNNWLPQNIGEVQLVAICSIAYQIIQRCTYGGGIYTVTRYQYHIDLELFDAKTGERAKEDPHDPISYINGGFLGSTPGSCPSQTSESKSIYGDKVPFSDAINWLRQYVEP